MTDHASKAAAPRHVGPLLEPRYSFTEAAAFANITTQLVAMWRARGLIKCAKRVFGTRRPLWSKLDLVRLVVVKSLADFHYPLVEAARIAEGAAAELLEKGELEWNAYMLLRPRAVSVFVNVAPGEFEVFDPRERSTADVVGPLKRWGTEKPGKIDADYRDRLARRGVFARPVLIFPIGEICMGTLAMLRAVDESEVE